MVKSCRQAQNRIYGRQRASDASFCEFIGIVDLKPMHVRIISDPRLLNA